MTISQYIVELLKRYKDIEIDTNHVQEGSDKYGLFKSPSREKKDFNDGSYQITEHYNLICRQSTLSKSERKESDEWLEDLTYWMDDFIENYEFPQIDGRRTVIDMSITGCPYPAAAENRETEYEINISITYIRERKVM